MSAPPRLDFRVEIARLDGERAESRLRAERDRKRDPWARRFAIKATAVGIAALAAGIAVGIGAVAWWEGKL
jgi:hypothetical protein